MMLFGPVPHPGGPSSGCPGATCVSVDTPHLDTPGPQAVSAPSRQHAGTLDPPPPSNRLSPGVSGRRTPPQDPSRRTGVTVAHPQGPCAWLCAGVEGRRAWG